MERIDAGLFSILRGSLKNPKYYEDWRGFEHKPVAFINVFIDVNNQLFMQLPERITCMRKEAQREQQ